MKGDIVGMANYEKQRLHTPPISLLQLLYTLAGALLYSLTRVRAGEEGGAHTIQNGVVQC